MSERFSKLFALPENLYCPDAPVMIAAGAIQKDNETGRVFGQLKLRNIQDKGIKAVKVSLSPFDTAGKPLGGPIEHQYLDLSAPRDGEFGPKSPIKLADANTRSFTVSVSEVVFTDGSVWAGTGGAWEPLTPPTPLEEVLEDAELVKQYRLKYGQDCKYQTKRERDLWFCACGAVNREGEQTCHRCGKELALLAHADLEALKEERDQRLAEESKRAAEAKAEAEAQAKKVKKIAMIAAPILVVLIVAGVFLSDYTKKSDAYNAAAALLEEREFDDAMDAFAELEDFKDSKEMAEQGVAYEKALYLIQCAEQEDKAGLKVSSKVKGEVNTEEDEDGNKPSSAAPAQADCYEASSDDSRPSSAESSTAVKCYRKAAGILEQLDDHKDSAQKLQEVNAAIDAAIEAANEKDYQAAMALLEDREFEDAWQALLSLGDYKDSSQLAQQVEKEMEDLVAAGEAYRKGELEPFLAVIENNQYVKPHQTDVDNISFLAKHIGKWEYLSGDPAAPTMRGRDSSEYYECRSVSTSFAMSNRKKPYIRLIYGDGSHWLSFDADFSKKALGDVTTYRGGDFSLELTARDTLLLTVKRYDDTTVTCEYRRVS